MKFMMLVKAIEASEAGVMPSQEMLDRMGAYNEELIKAGVLVDLAGLKPSSKGARIRFSGGKPVVIDGPFAETKELVAGFWIIETKSYEEALEWAKRVPGTQEDGCGEIELRPFFELEDFESSPAIDRLRERRARFEAQKK